MCTAGWADINMVQIDTYVHQGSNISVCYPPVPIPLINK